MSKIKTVIITGAIGCGKSTVINMFHDLYGVPCIKTDDVAKFVRSTAYCEQWIMNAFGDCVKDHHGNFSLDGLRTLLFTNREAKKLFNHFIQPKVMAMVEQGVNELRYMGGMKYILVELPVVEDMHDDCKKFMRDATIVNVQCDFSTQLSRITKRNPNLSNELIDSLIESQIDAQNELILTTPKMLFIDNGKDQNLDSLRGQVESINLMIESM